ncbi:MAG TPA: DUF2934 domain-containing protein [Steroidobacteraceae bacterium]|nr:DUF2934 domain-containing protein [Steroidobacteraceae bacterium]
MATRRSAGPPRTPELPKEIPKVIRAEEKSPPGAPRKTAAPRARKPTQSPPPAVTIPDDVRRGMIAEGAYLRAEKRGFAAGHETEDWLAAEAEVDRLLKARHGGTSQ